MLLKSNGAGGHGGIVKRAGGMVLQKPTNDIERMFYEHLRDSGDDLERIVPRSFTFREVLALESQSRPSRPVAVVDAGASEVSPHIYIENIAHGMTHPRLLDIKVGESTSSQRELGRNLGTTDAWLKKRKMKVADTVTRSAERGWRIVGGSGIDGSRVQIGRGSNQHLAHFVGLADGLADRLMAQLREIRYVSARSSHAFVAASVLIAVDQGAKNDDQLAKVKLIDFAHAFTSGDLGPQQYAKYRTRFLRGIDDLIDEIRKIKNLRSAGKAGETLPSQPTVAGSHFGLAALGESFAGPLTAATVKRMLAGYRGLSTDAEVHRLLDEVVKVVDRSVYTGPGAVGTGPRMNWPGREERPDSGGHTRHRETGAEITLGNVRYVEDQIATVVHELVHVSVHSRYGVDENVDPGVLQVREKVTRFETYARSRVVELVRLLPESGLPLGWREASRQKLVGHVGMNPTLEYDGVLAGLLIWSDLYGDMYSAYHRLLSDLVAETRVWRAAGHVTVPDVEVGPDVLTLLGKAADASVEHPPRIQVPFVEGDRTTVAAADIVRIDSLAQDVARTAVHHARRGLPLPEVTVSGYGNGAWLPSKSRSAQAVATGFARAATAADIFREVYTRALDALPNAGGPVPHPDALRITEVSVGRAALPPGAVEGNVLQNAVSHRVAVIEVTDRAAGFDVSPAVVADDKKTVTDSNGNVWQYPSRSDGVFCVNVAVAWRRHLPTRGGVRVPYTFLACDA